jgi:hypothetical protein
MMTVDIKNRITVDQALHHKFLAGLSDVGYDVCPLAMVSIRHVEEVFGCLSDGIDLSDIKPGLNRSEERLGLNATLRQIKSDIPPKEVRDAAFLMGKTYKLGAARETRAAASAVLPEIPKGLSYRHNDKNIGSGPMRSVMSSQYSRVNQRSVRSAKRV